MKNILVLCTGNSCRSQIAHGYLNFYCKGKANIYSAGIEVHGVNPIAVEAMMDDGIDISMNSSNNIDEYMSINFDYIITVCDHANENCPFIPSMKAIRIHQNFIDPSKFDLSEEESKNKFILVMNQIKEFCLNFANDNFQ
jgi:arsenate reductase